MNLYYYLDEDKWAARMENGFIYSPAFLPGIFARAGACAKPVTLRGIADLTKEDALVIGADILDIVPENVGALILLGGLVGAEKRPESDGSGPAEENPENVRDIYAEAAAAGEKENVTNLADCTGDCASCGGSCGEDEDSGPDPKVYEILLRTRPKGDVRASYMAGSEMLPLPVPILPVAGTFQPMRMAVNGQTDEGGISAPALIWRGDLFFDFRFDLAMAVHYMDRAGDTRGSGILTSDLVRVLRMCGIPLYYENMFAAKSSVKPADLSGVTIVFKDGVLRISTDKPLYLQPPGTPQKAYLDGMAAPLFPIGLNGETARMLSVPAGQHRISWQ